MKPHLPYSLALALALAPLSHAALTTADLLYHWDASDNTTATAGTWSSKAGSQGTTNDDWAIQTGVTRQSVASLTAITDAYDFTGWVDLSPTGSATRIEFAASSGITGVSTTTPTAKASMEFWIKPDGLANGRQVIFESGGSTRGYFLGLDNDELFFASKPATPGAGAAPTVLATTTLIAADITDFIQVVMTIDTVSKTIELYANAVSSMTPETLADSHTHTGGDHPFGTSDASLAGANSAGGANGELGGGGSSTVGWRKQDFVGFEGQIGILRVYNDVLTGAEVKDNFEFTTAIDALDDTGTTDEATVLTTVDPAATASLLANDNGLDLTVARADSASASGAPVTVNTDGTFSYDPSGVSAFNILAVGESALDTFTYCISTTRDTAASAGLTFETDATAATDTFAWTALPAAAAATGTNLPASITMAHEFDGTAGATRATLDSVSTLDASWEFWLKPDVVNTSQTIFETGGNGTGSGFYLNDDGTVSFLIKNGSNPFVQSGAVLNAGEWYHIVGTYDKDNPGTTDTLTLYLNGCLEGVATATNANDFAGGDATGLGTVNGTSAGDAVDIDGAGGIESYGNFDGQIAIARFYSAVVLPVPAYTDEATVSITVNGANDVPVVAGETANTVLGGIVNLGLLANDSDVDATDTLTVSNIVDGMSNGGAAPLTFASDEGATVTVAADGTFTYDPTTSTNILGLAPGATITETFTYDVFDGTATVQTTAVITSTGLALPTNDYAATNAVTVANIDVLANDRVRNTASVGTATAGAAVELIASGAGNDDTTWNNTGSGGGTVTMQNPGTESVRTTGLTDPAGITAAYTLSGTNSGSSILAPAASGTIFGGDISPNSATFEIVFRPADQVGNVCLLDLGGATTGSNLALVGDQLILTWGEGGSVAAQAVATLPSTAVAGGEFVHVVGIFDDPGDTARLYVNGALAAETGAIHVNSGAAAAIGDWSGGDVSGIGQFNGSVGGDIGPLGNSGTLDLPVLSDFDGELAIVRFYSSILTGTQIGDNFDAVFGSNAAAVAADITDLAGGGVPSVGIPVALPSTSTVTLTAGGLIDYAPGAAFADLGVGIVIRDSFTYTLNTSPAATITVVVDVTGTNANPKVTIAADQTSVTEGSDAEFTITADAAVSGNVTVNLVYSGTAHDGNDFTGQTSIDILDTQTTADLNLVTIADSIYDGGGEIIEVTIDSVTGNGARGATLTASTILDDTETAPVLTIARDQLSVAEGSPAGFTITASGAADEPISISLGYPGTATPVTDFTTAAAVIPASTPGSLNTSFDLDLPTVGDAVSDTGETIRVNLNSVSIGSIGTPSGDYTILTDGSDEVVFLADFDDVTVDQANPDPDTTLLNAGTAANSGTAIGSWVNVFVSSPTGDDPGVYSESNDDGNRDDGTDNVLVLDRPGTGDDDVTARFAKPLDFSGSNEGVICFDAVLRRTLADSNVKDVKVTGLDEFGVKSFEFRFDTDDNSATADQIIAIDNLAIETAVGIKEDFTNSGSDEQETDHTTAVLRLTAAGYTIAIDKNFDGLFESTSGTLAYAGTATQVSEILISIPGSEDGNTNGGIEFDEIKAVGVAGNAGPSLTFDGAEVADMGTTVLAQMSTGTTKSFDSANSAELQIADPDAASIIVQLQALFSFGTITVNPQGSASISAGSNGSSDLTVSGTVADVNATLTAGIDFLATSIGTETIQVTVDDGGSSGAGGAKSVQHNFTVTIVANPTVTINQAAGETDPSLAAPIDFTVVFSEEVTGFGAEASDVDLTAGSAPGTLAATVTEIAPNDGTTYNVAVTGMTGNGTVVATIPAMAAQSLTAQDNVASSSTDNSVQFILNVEPEATNLAQNFATPTGAMGEMVQLNDIFVSDANNIFDSQVSTLGNPRFSYDGGTNVTSFDGGSPAPAGPLFTLPVPNLANGFSYDLRFTPSVADLAAGGLGTENRRAVFEGGGTSNGNGLYLIEGSLQLIVKMNGANTTELTPPLPDTDWTGDVIAVELASSLTAGEEASVAVIFDLDSVRYSINGGPETTVALTNRGGKSDWSGNESVSIGRAGSAGGALTVNGTGGLYDETLFGDLDNNVTSFRYWNGSGSGFLLGDFEEATVKIQIDGFVDPATSGTLSDTSGNGEGFNTGTGEWSITGPLVNVNAALADVKFTFGSGGAPVLLTVMVQDGLENGSMVLMGAVSIVTPGPGPVYVDNDFTGLPGDAIIDGDLGAAGDQGATLGVDAFTNLTDAQAAAGDTATIIVNDGDYSGESVTLSNTQSLRLAATAGPVSVGSLTTLSTNTLDLQGNTLAANSGIIASTIADTGGGGGLTKNGTGTLVLQNTTAHNGTTTVNGGILRIGTDGATLLGDLGGNGPVVVTSPGVLEFNPLLTTQTITQTGNISGTGSLSTIGDGTVVFNTAGGNTFSGGFDLGDGTTSSYNGTTGAQQGFVVVNHSDDLGSGKILSRGSQLQAGSPGVVIPNDIDITNGGFRCGGTIDFSFSGQINPIGGNDRGFGNYGLDGLDLTITAAGGVDNTNGRVVPEGTDGADNGSWTFDCDITGSGGFLLQSSFDGGEVSFNGNNTYAGATEVRSGTLVLNGAHSGGLGYTILTGATLAGGGSTDAVVTVNAGATLSPGASVGSLATGGLTLAGTLVVEVDDTTGAGGTAYDQVVVTGLVNVTGATVEVIDLKNTVEAIPAEISIISNDDTDVVTGTPGSVTGPADYLGSGSAAEVSTAGGSDSNDVVINPSAALTIIGQWRFDNFAGDPSNTGAGANNNDAEGAPDGRENLLEFAFGTGPNVVDPGVLVVNSPTDFDPGDPFNPPGATTPADFVYQYVRRTDFVAAGLTYTPEFSANGIDFFPATGPETVLSTEGLYQVIEVPFEIFLPNGMKSNTALARMRVTLD